MIDDAMRQVFIDTYHLYELERSFNYQNYGRYPYRDRKNSVQIVADFNANAYSVNGLFVTEESYLQFYLPEVIETVERVLVNVSLVQDMFFQAVTIIANGDDEGETIELIGTFEATATAYERYETIVTREYVEVEATEVQTVRYLFPFNCVPDSLGRLVLSL